MPAIPARAHLIPEYDSYFFPLRETASAGAPAGTSIEVALSVLASTQGPDPHDAPRVEVYDVRVIDLERNDFPERHVFFEQVKLFEPAGGDLYRILTGQRRPSLVRRSPRLRPTGRREFQNGAPRALRTPSIGPEERSGHDVARRSRSARPGDRAMHVPDHGRRGDAAARPRVSPSRFR